MQAIPNRFAGHARALSRVTVAASLLVAGPALAAPCEAPPSDPNRPVVGLYLDQVRAIDETEHDGWGEGVANDALRLVGAVSSRTPGGTTSCELFSSLGDNYQDGTRISFNRPLAYVPLDRFPTDAIASFVLVEEDWSSTDYAALQRDLSSATNHTWDFGVATATGLVIGGTFGAVYGVGGQIIVGAVGAVVGLVVDIIGGAVVSAESDIFPPAALALTAPSPEHLSASLPMGRTTMTTRFSGFGGEYELTFSWRLPQPTSFEGDFNGDGRSDVAVWRAADHSWQLNLSTGVGFRRETWTGAWGSDGPVHVGDFNGDGRDDPIMWRASNHDWTVNLSTGSGFSFRVWGGAYGSDGPIFVGDFNGDGRDDVMMWRASNRDWTVNLSTGSGFAFRVVGRRLGRGRLDPRR